MRGADTLSDCSVYARWGRNMLIVDRIYRVLRKGKLFILVFLLLFVACKGSGAPEGNDGIIYPDETFVETPDNLVAYFDSLLQSTPAFIYTMNIDDLQPNPDSLAVLNSIKALDDYQAHRRNDYPREQVADALGMMIFAQWHYDTHGDGDEDEMAGSEQFFLRYLEQVARLCPHVVYLTSIHTGDDKAGIFTGHEFSEWHQPYYCLLLYRCGAGYRMKFLQHYIGYDKIWELYDSVGRNYILCYNGDTDMDKDSWPFKAILFLEEETGYVEVCLSEGWVSEEEYDESGFYIDYNPRTYTWTKCRQRGKKKIPIPHRKSLRLMLDGKQSSFCIL